MGKETNTSTNAIAYSMGLASRWFMCSWYLETWYDNPNKGELHAADGTFPASIRHPWWNPPEGEQVFNCWVKTTTDTGLMFCLKGYYLDADKQPVSPGQLEEDTFSIRGSLQWWDAETGKCAIAISPNKDATRQFKPFFVVIQGHLPKPRKGSFWEIEATREGDKLVLLDGREVFPPQKKKKPGKGKGKGKDKPKPQSKQQATPA